MTFEYTVEESDYLDFQLYAASTSDRIRKKEMNGRIFLTLGAVVAGLYFFYQQHHIPMAIYCGFFAVATALFYPRYFRWRYKKHYQTHIRELYAKRFGTHCFLEINEDSILAKDKTGEGKLSLSEIEQVNETQNHFFMKVSTGISLIIPKRELTDVSELRNMFKEVGLTVNDETNWTWK